MLLFLIIPTSFRFMELHALPLAARSYALLDLAYYVAKPFTSVAR